LGKIGCVSTAQDSFSGAVREVLRPRMAALGFIGSGTTFTMPSDTHFAVIGLQKSQFSDRRSLKFTANVTVVPKDVWAALRASKPHLPARPAPNTFYGTEVWQRRIGKLLPTGEDKWWSITSDADADVAAVEVAALIEHHVLPEMRAHLSA